MGTSDLDRFHTWVVDRGRDEQTANLYQRQLRSAFGHEKGWRGRLNDRNLSPKTRHVIKASLRAWARYKDDEALEKQLKDIKLPTAQRAKAKRPLERKEWAQLLGAIDEAPEPAPVRAVIGLMAVRGFRVGDVLRMTRKEIKAAVAEGIVSYEAKGGRRLEFGVLSRMKKYLKMLVSESPDWSRVSDIVSPEAAFESARHRIYMALRRVAASAGLKPNEVHPHRLRRTVAVYFLEETGGDVVKLKQYFQWASVEVAAGYVDHNQREELDKIGEDMIP
jgi:integrase